MLLDDFLAKYGSKFTRDPVFGCWRWTDRSDMHGYGTLYGRGGPRQAHRAAYEALVGPVPAGLLLDHLCRRRNCCRPDHLEPVTDRENQLRRSPAYRVRRKACRNDHALTDPIVTPEGGRLCRTCQGPERAPVFAANPADAQHFDPPLDVGDFSDFNGTDRVAGPRGLTADRYGYVISDEPPTHSRGAFGVLLDRGRDPLGRQHAFALPEHPLARRDDDGDEP